MQIQDIFSVQTLFISLGIGVIIQFVKSICETKWPSLINSKNYNHVYLPSLSLIIGIVLALFTGTLPGFLATGTVTDRIILGTVCGWFSSFIFRGANAMLHKELNISESTYPDVDSIPKDPKVPTFPSVKDIK